MEFANHFAKIHPLVSPNDMYFRCQVHINVDVSTKQPSFWANFLLIHISSFISDESGHLTDLKTAYINRNVNLTPEIHSIWENQRMDFGKMVCKFHFCISRVEFIYMSKFQQNRILLRYCWVVMKIFILSVRWCTNLQKSMVVSKLNYAQMGQLLKSCMYKELQF